MRLRPKRVVGDKGYPSKNFRKHLRKRGIRYTIPRRSNENHKGSFDKSIYRERNKVERLFSRLKEFRRIATRYDKRAANYAATLTIAAIFLWSQGFAYTPSLKGKTGFELTHLENFGKNNNLRQRNRQRQTCQKER